MTRWGTLTMTRTENPGALRNSLDLPTLWLESAPCPSVSGPVRPLRQLLWAALGPLEGPILRESVHSCPRAPGGACVLLAPHPKTRPFLAPPALVVSHDDSDPIGAARHAVHRHRPVSPLRRAARRLVELLGHGIDVRAKQALEPRLRL